MAKIKELEKAQIKLNGLLDVATSSVFSRLNCHNVGKILEFDKTTQTATVQLLQIKQFKTSYRTPAPLMNVPLIIYGAGGGHITLPDPAGTICLLFFNDRNFDALLETGEAYAPNTARMHDMTDCIALTTFKTLNAPIADYDDKAITIYMQEILEEVKNESFIKVYSNSIQMAYKQGEAQSNLIIADKITISNTAQSLAALIQELLAACEAITTVNGGALTSASQQLFTDLKTKFEELLQ